MGLGSRLTTPHAMSEDLHSMMNYHLPSILCTAAPSHGSCIEEELLINHSCKITRLQHSPQGIIKLTMYTQDSQASL